MSKKQRSANMASVIAFCKDMSKLCYDIAKGLLLFGVIGFFTSKLTLEATILFLVAFLGFIMAGYAFTVSAAYKENLESEQNDD